MTTAWGGILPEGKAGGDSLLSPDGRQLRYVAGWMDIKVGDLLFTAMIVLASCIADGVAAAAEAVALGFAGRDLCADYGVACLFPLVQKPMRAQIYESFLAFLPGIAGAYAGAMGRGVVDNLFPNK